MERKSAKLEQQQRQELESLQQTQSTPAPRVFESVEEMLRHDAAQTQPPAQLEHRLAESVADLPPPPRPWWRRLFKSR